MLNSNLTTKNYWIIKKRPLRACETRSQCISLAPPRAPLEPSLLHSIVSHAHKHFTSKLLNNFSGEQKLNNSRNAQLQAQYLCHCAFLVLFCHTGSKKTCPNHVISISLALVTLPAGLRR